MKIKIFSFFVVLAFIFSACDQNALDLDKSNGLSDGSSLATRSSAAQPVSSLSRYSCVRNPYKGPLSASRLEGCRTACSDLL